MTTLRTRLERLEAKRAKKPEWPHWPMKLSDGRTLDFFYDRPEVLDILGWGYQGPSTVDVEIVGL